MSIESRNQYISELKYSDEVAKKLKEISFRRTVEEKLKPQKEIERVRKRYQKRIHPALSEDTDLNSLRENKIDQSPGEI